MRSCLVTLAFLAFAPSALRAQSAMAVEFYHLDGQGNVLALTDWNGTVVESHDYDVFGQEVMDEYTRLGTQPRRFTGKERDTETGWDYFGARYYGSKIGRFTTVDPYVDSRAALFDPQRWNRYAYGLNNPLRNVDSDGRDAWDIVTGAANAFGSNFSLGLGRQSAYNSDFGRGQFLGDLTSIPAGYLWGDAGGTIAALGVVGAPESGGATLVATGAGVAIMVQGGTASLAGLTNAGLYLSKNVGEAGGPKVGSEGGPGAGKRFSEKTKDAARAENPNCVFCDRPTTREPGPTQSNIDHAKAKAHGGNNTTANAQNTCRECNQQKGTKSTEEFLRQ
jgi:RHS repeat-associated protein